MFWYCPSDYNCVQWIYHNFMAIFSLLWPKKGYFCQQRHKILIFETGNMVKKWSKLYQTMCLILPYRLKSLQWISHDFRAIFSLLWPKKVYFCHQRHKILNFQTVNVVKNGANSTRLCVLIPPFWLESLSVYLL